MSEFAVLISCHAEGRGAWRGNVAMSIRALLAAVAVIAIPIAVNGQEAVRPAKDASMKKVCREHIATGSRLNRVRRCMTSREEEEYKRELGTDLSRQQLDRRQ
jgi:hypothetical protein